MHKDRCPFLAWGHSNPCIASYQRIQTHSYQHIAWVCWCNSRLITNRCAHCCYFMSWAVGWLEMITLWGVCLSSSSRSLISLCLALCMQFLYVYWLHDSSITASSRTNVNFGVIIAINMRSLTATLFDFILANLWHMSDWIETCLWERGERMLCQPTGLWPSVSTIRHTQQNAQCYASLAFQ